MISTPTRKTAALTAGALFAAVAVGAVYAAIPGAGGVIHGCYKTSHGQLRVIDDTTDGCLPSETALVWSQTGPAGPAGPAGPIGPVGPVGPIGPAGPAGEDGASAAISSHRGTGPVSAPPGAAFTTVVTRAVPEGFYVFVAKAVITTDTSTGSDCILTYDLGAGEIEADRSNQSPFNSSVTARTTHNLQRLLQFGTGAATVRLNCRAGTEWTATESGIIAIQVQSASDSEVTG
jgi:hypothetical protein